MYKIEQSGGFLGRILGPLLKIGQPLIGNVLKLLAKSVLMSLGLTAAALATDLVINKKMFGSGNTTLLISNKELNYVMKIVTSLKEFVFSKTTKIEAKEQKGGFFRMILCTLGASLLGNLLTGKGTIREGEGKIRAGQDFYAALSFNKF